MDKTARTFFGVAVCCAAVAIASPPAAACELYIFREKVCLLIDDWPQCAALTVDKRYAETNSYRCLLEDLTPVADCALITIAPNIWLSPKSVRDGYALAVRRTAMQFPQVPRPWRAYDAAQIKASCRPACFPRTNCEP